MQIKDLKCNIKAIESSKNNDILKLQENLDELAIKYKEKNKY